MKLIMIAMTVLMLTGCVGGGMFQKTEGEREMTWTLYDGPFGKIGQFQSKFKGKYDTPTPEQIEAEKKAKEVSK
jgi:hypothetical protein